MRQLLITALFIASAAFSAIAQASTDTQAQQPSTAVTPAAPASTDASAPPKKKAKHVYTSEDMKAADPNDMPSSASTSGDTGAASVAGASDTGKDEKGKSAKKSAKKPGQEEIAAQQAKVDDLKQQVDGTSKVVADIQRLIDQEPSRAAGMGAGLAKNQSDLADLKKQLDSAQSQLDAMKNPK